MQLLTSAQCPGKCVPAWNTWMPCSPPSTPRRGRLTHPLDSLLAFEADCITRLRTLCSIGGTLKTALQVRDQRRRNPGQSPGHDLAWSSLQKVDESEKPGKSVNPKYVATVSRYGT